MDKKENDSRLKEATSELNDRARSLDWKNYDEVKEYLDNLKIEYSFQCFSEKRPDGCYRLSNFLENVQNKYEEAVELYKMNCDVHKFPRSCYQYAKARLVGRGLSEDAEEAHKYLKIGCELKDSISCFHLGLIELYGEKGVTQDVDNAVRLIEQSCDRNIPDACVEMFSVTYKGSKHEAYKNPEKAIEFAKKACDLGSFKGCVNASVMYKLGDGIEADKKLSTFYKQKAIEIKKAAEKLHAGVAFGEEHKHQ